MASKKQREVHFKLTDDDYKAFGSYRIMYTDQGHKLVRRQRLTFLLTGIMIAVLFTVFHVDQRFTYMMYILAAILIIVGLFFAETLVLRQQDKAIEASKNSAERVHAPENIVRFDEDQFHTIAGDDEQSFAYKDIKLIDLTQEAIYVWLSDEMIMSLPLHAFRNMDEMKEYYKWIKEKIQAQGGTVK